MMWITMWIIWVKIVLNTKISTRRLNCAKNILKYYFYIINKLNNLVPYSWYYWVKITYERIMAGHFASMCITRAHQEM